MDTRVEIVITNKSGDVNSPTSLHHFIGLRNCRSLFTGVVIIIISITGVVTNTTSWPHNGAYS